LAKFANPVTINTESSPKVPAMPTRNVNLTVEQDRFVASRIEEGRYGNASEVVRAALRTLEREEREFELKLAAVRTAIDEGDASGIAHGNAFARIRKSLKLPAPTR
jgi:antitoxin ParD1/3/4